ncbi:hypothetical protein VZT92_003297 [Zoarces viviparus]|uniref:Ig-like domain-containing protein n=1 Tax=Zoarces viviparus TaxID=48416 RepID=A0AAW1G1Y8_ZOAVI
MSGAAMRLTAAVSGFVIFLLSASVIQGQNVWRVTYTSTQICALKGSTVNITCSYTRPSKTTDGDTRVERAFWFTKTQDEEPVDLRTDPQYAGRVQYSYRNNACTLSISDLRDSDSAVFKFRFITNHPDWRYTGEPGVTLSVTGFQVKISQKQSCRAGRCTWADLTCHSSCRLTYSTSYNWYKNGVKMRTEKESFRDYFYHEDSYSCAARGYEAFPSPSECVGDQTCKKVTYPDRSICAFKGSSVDISCTYYNGYKYIASKFWFSSDHHQRRYLSRAEDLRKDSRYTGRVQVFDTERGRSTLRITDLRESDSAEYHFKFKTGSDEWSSSLPATTLTVTDPDVQVQVIWSTTGPKLICHSSCLPSGRSSLAWYQNETKRIQDETSPSYGGYVDPVDSYSCSYQSYRSPPVYAPRVPVVLMSRSGDIMKNSSVTLTCSSDANPAANYTWYKENQSVLGREPQLVFSSIQSSDSGEYYCRAENDLGTTSEYVFIDVKYGPKLPSVSVSPSAQIVEGSSVTLTCSSDANPAANYTWYKEDQTLLQGPEGVHRFTSISSHDSGNYRCQSENQYRRINSTTLVLDVQYGPKRPSVSNNIGRSNSTLHLTVVAAAWKSAVVGTITAVLPAIALLAVCLWIRRKKSFTQQSHGGERPAIRAQLNMDLVRDVTSAPAPRQPAEHLHYSSIRFTQNQEEALYSNIRPAQPHRQTEEEHEEEEEEEVEYTDINTDNARSSPRTRREEDEEDSSALYSTVNK